MADSIRLDAGEAGILEVHKPSREHIRTWYDTMVRMGVSSTANQNLWADVAITPPPSELATFIDDFDALPMMVVAEVLDTAGYKMGGGDYPSIALEDLPPELAELAAKQRRKPLAFATPAGICLFKTSGGTAEYSDETTRFASGKEGASRYEALRGLVIARALHPAPADMATAIELYPGIPIVLEDRLLEAAGTGGKALARL